MIFKNKELDRISDKVQVLSNFQKSLENEITALRILFGSMLANNNRIKDGALSLEEFEFKIFSQFGDDGIIQFLINFLDIDTEIFIEFGVQDYKESNTRFLLMNNNWKGLIIDGDKDAMEKLKTEEFYWRYDLTAIGAFISKENVNAVFTENGFKGEIGILSIDIDGNDYWIWESIYCVNPIVVIIEYNSVFGKNCAISTPYQADFLRSNAHSSNLFWGASLKALVSLGEKRGYSFVGCNSAGNNAYFIRNSKMGNLRRLNCEEGYVESKFRESRNKLGDLTFLSGSDRLKEILDCEVVEIESGKLVKIRDLERKI